MKRRKYQPKVGYALYGGIFSLVGITLFSGLILASTHASADSVVTTATINVITSCSFSAGGGTYNISVNGNSSAEQTANPITTSCNDASGYAIYAIGYSNDSYTGTNTDLISSLGSSYNIKTDGSGTYGSSWRMKLTDPSNATIATGFDTYHDIPSTFTKVASYTSNTSAGSITPKYQVTVNGSQPAGTYTGKVKYVLVHPNTAVAGQYSIAYNANGGTGTMASSTDIYNFEPFTLPASTFTAPNGYQFAGWCTTQDQAQSPQTTCSGPLYSAGDEVTSLGTAGSTVNLYAIWGALPTMQAFSSSDATGMNTGDSTTLIDTRDGESYTVAKLADGKVWMTTNLNLAGGTTLSAADTDMDSSWTLPTANGFQAGNKLPASSPTGTSVSGYYTDDTMAYLTNSGSTTCASGSPCYSYYSWTTATLGSGLSIETDNTDAPYSICPKGWRLPTSRTTSATNWQTESDFYALAHQYGLDSTTSTSESDNGFYTQAGPGTVPNFLLGGNYYGGSFFSGGSSGYYWSATSGSSSTGARNLYFGSSYVVSANNSSRRSGFSVRCVFGE